MPQAPSYASTTNVWRLSSTKPPNWGFRLCFIPRIPTLSSPPSIASTSAMRNSRLHPEWSFYGSSVSKVSVLQQRNHVIARHPHTTFVGAHLAESSEDLGSLASLLDLHPNLYVDISARVAELGRQPNTAREFVIRYADRILFGADLLPDVEMYRLYYRFLETADEYFEYPSHASRQGRWNIYGISLPGDVLHKIYRENALKLLNLRAHSGTRSIRCLAESGL